MPDFPEFTLTCTDLGSIIAGDATVTSADLLFTELLFTSSIVKGDVISYGGGVYIADTVRGIIDSDGVLKHYDLDGDLVAGVPLLADDPGLGLETSLEWAVEFKNAKVKGFPRTITGWSFLADVNGATLDLSAVTRVPGSTAIGVTRGIQGIQGIPGVAGPPGDATTNTATSVDSEVAVFSGTTGKILKRFTGTGMMRIVSGVASVVSRTIDGQTFDGSANITVIAPGTVAATGKTTPVDADVFPIADSAASNVLKKVTWANVKATLKAYLDTAASTYTTKSISLTTNTITGTVAEFNTALQSADFYTSGGTDVALADGGTGASTAAAARTNLGSTTVGDAVFIAVDAAAARTAIGAGSGGGDASTNTASSVDSELAIFSSTTGKLLKRATTTGLLKGTSGVLSAAAAGTDYVAPGGALGTPSSGTLTSCTGLPAAGLVASTSQAVGFGTVELGHASDTTISRLSAGVIAVEGVEIPTILAGTNLQTGTTYTLALTDGGKVVELNNASAITLTVPTNASIAFPIGTVLELHQYGAGQVTVAAAVGVTLNSPGGKTKIAARYGSASLRKRATNEWQLEGNITT